MDRVLIVSSALLWIVVLFNLLLTLALIRRLNGQAPGTQRAANDGPPAGQAAPAFLAETLQGATVTLATYAGRELAMLFISPRCGPCREMLPYYLSLGSRAARAGVDLVLVSSANAAETQAFVDEFNIRLPVLVAPLDDHPLIKDYNIPGTPFYCLIDAQGIVQSSGYPSKDWGAWKAATDTWAAAPAPISTLVLDGGR